MCQHRHGPLICGVVCLGLVSVGSRRWVGIPRARVLGFFPQVGHKLWLRLDHMEGASRVSTTRQRVDTGPLSRE